MTSKREQRKWTKLTNDAEALWTAQSLTERQAWLRQAGVNYPGTAKYRFGQLPLHLIQKLTAVLTYNRKTKGYDLS
jgi:hypothetical protein